MLMELIGPPLPNWVPDVQMIYRHVARGIQPSFNGGAFQSNYNIGDVFTNKIFSLL